MEPDEAEQVIEDIHDGYCGNHKGGRSMESKVLRTGYFWPTLRADCLAYSSKTTPKISTCHTPYAPVYGCEALIPAEIHVTTSRCSLNTVEENQPLMQDNLTLAEELRDAAKIRIASYHQTVARSYNKNVNIRLFKEGDLVLRKVFPNTKDKNAGKLGPAWEGPYLIGSIVGQGAYRLQTLDREMIPRSWNISHLKLFHV
ncbi:uncharacterized protein LOC141629193 [Silene latifolia]|uniref:uncharacterized protein LOC141629193 n=1 Tax=Silene latifolia TaxID=37657 RepID=UPI003D774757